MATENFYEELPAFDDFSGITDADYYRDVPEGWGLFVTDVKNSTEAINSGNYRDVNKIGAASITVVKQALEGVEFPFVFGGDGATIALPPEHVDRATNQLLGLKQLARDQFELDLRVGYMTVDHVTQQTVSLEVAKLRITEGREIAIFRGGGITMADDLIKRERSLYEAEGDSAGDMELTGLSCRWQPIPSEHGNVLSIMVQARKTPPEPTYQRVITKLDEILEGGLGQANPIKPSDMSYRSARECLVDEVRYHTSIVSLSFLFRVIEIILAVAVFKFGVNPFFFDPAEYSDQLRTHSDYRKFDDMLRLIIDCDDDERDQIKSALLALKDSEEIFYGIQEAEESLMTCYVEDLHQGGHLHFIDGGGGGYAKAAKQLKDQVRQAAVN